MTYKITIWLASISILILTGCNQISGTVKAADGSALAGVTVTIDGPKSYTTLTDENGQYTFYDVANGNYTVTPSFDKFTFEPESAEVALNYFNVVVPNFSGSAPDHISGYELEMGEPEAVILTSDWLKSSFEQFAVFHTVTGTYTSVMTVEEICNGACDDDDQISANDTPVVIKNYIMTLPNLEYLVIGGTVDVVPPAPLYHDYEYVFEYLGLRLIEVTRQDSGETILTDFFYADFDDWDSNGNGVYLEAGADTPSDMRPEIAVSRIPVSSPPEAMDYFQKVVDHTTSYRTDHIKKSLLCASVIDTFSILGNEVDFHMAWYLHSKGRTIDIIEENSDFEILKQYTPAEPMPESDAEVYTFDGHFSAIDAGQNIILYKSHGSPKMLFHTGGSDRIVSADILSLTNTTYPIVFAEGCHTGDLRYTDSVGELMVNQPNGGAIVLIGNTGYGNTLSGQFQFSDELLRAMLERPSPLMADAVYTAYNSKPIEDYFVYPLSAASPSLPDFESEVVTLDSYKYSQAASVVLGDILIPVWNRPVSMVYNVDITVEEIGPSTNRVTITADESVKTIPVLCVGGAYYGFDKAGNHYQVDVPKYETISVGFPYVAEDHQSFYAEIQ